MTDVVMLSISVLSFMVAGVILGAALGGAEAPVSGTGPEDAGKGGGRTQS
ncbi:MAG: hypothetical protein ABFS34_05655 [Gemmatimonadota bacterium]